MMETKKMATDVIACAKYKQDGDVSFLPRQIKVNALDGTQKPSVAMGLWRMVRLVMMVSR